MLYPTNIFIINIITKKEAEKTIVLAILLMTLETSPMKRIIDRITINSSIVLLNNDNENSIIEKNNLILGSSEWKGLS
jgi:hypothetical protein